MFAIIIHELSCKPKTFDNRYVTTPLDERFKSQDLHCEIVSGYDLEIVLLNEFMDFTDYGYIKVWIEEYGIVESDNCDRICFYCDYRIEFYSKFVYFLDIWIQFLF
jgi:hypothetical protein